MAVEAAIERAVVAPGHDGSAELVVHLRYANGGTSSVTLDARSAERLFDRCGAKELAQLVGQPWRHLMYVLETGD